MAEFPESASGEGFSQQATSSGENVSRRWRKRERERESDCGCGDVQTRLTSCKSRSGVALCGGFALEVLDGNASFQRGRPWGCQGAGGRSIT